MMQIFWYGNATVKVTNADGASIMFDPFFSRNPAFSYLNADDISEVQAILVTHGHFDHVADLPAISAQYKKNIHAPSEVNENLRSRMHIPSDLLHDAVYDSPSTIESFSVQAFISEHVKFDLPLIGSTLGGLLRNLNRETFAMLRRNMTDHLNMPMGRCIGWHVEADGKSLLHFGSLAFNPQVAYPENVDVLSLPFQGNSEVDILALAAVEKLKPKSVFLHHFDNSFPPISSAVHTGTFENLMKRKHPKIPVFIPEYRKPLSV